MKYITIYLDDSVLKKIKEHVNLQKQTGQTQPEFGIYTCIVNEVYIKHIYCRQ